MKWTWLFVAFALIVNAQDSSEDSLDTADLDRLAEELQAQLDAFNADSSEEEVGMLDKDGWIVFPPDDVPFDAADPLGNKYWKRKKAEAASEAALARRERGRRQDRDYDRREPRRERRRYDSSEETEVGDFDLDDLD